MFQTTFCIVGKKAIEILVQSHLLKMMIYPHVSQQKDTFFMSENQDIPDRSLNSDYSVELHL